MKNNDLTKVLKRSHQRKWVALSADRTKVLASSKKLMDLKNKVNGREDVIYMKVLPSDTVLTF